MDRTGRAGEQSRAGRMLGPRTRGCQKARGGARGARGCGAARETRVPSLGEGPRPNGRGRPAGGGGGGGLGSSAPVGRWCYRLHCCGDAGKRRRWAA